MNKFVINQFGDLHALHRVFREAKFCDVANDDEVSTSPIVADLYAKLLAALVEAEVEEFGEPAREKWRRWLQTGPDRDEWRAVLQRIKKCAEWQNWSDEERIDYARLLFSPFLLTSDLENQLIKESMR